jgi:hypothetical protein
MKASHAIMNGTIYLSRNRNLFSCCAPSARAGPPWVSFAGSVEVCRPILTPRTISPTEAETTSKRCPASASLAGGYGALGEAEHVGALGVLGAAAAFVRRELAVRVDLALEPLEELLAGCAGAGRSVVGAAPRDFSRDPLVDVLGCYETSPPQGVTQCNCLIVCLSGCVRAFTCRHARETVTETIRETVTHREAPRW